MYRIHMNRCQFHSHIGVFPAEKETGQTITIDLILTVKDEPVNDSIENTVSYGEVYEDVKGIVVESRVDLIETLGQDIMHAVLEKYPLITKVEIKVNKVGLPIDGILDSVSVEMERTR
ncbi:dihydroneopterin aldolase [Aerococcus vaginalis]